MNKSNTIKELATALCKAQAEFEAVPENATNPFLRNKYADLGSVIASAKPVLVKNGLSISQLVTSEAERVGVTTILMHQSGEWIESTVTLPTGEEKGKSLAQVAGSVVTYLRRYGYSSILGLYTDEDDDGNGKAKQQKPSQPPNTMREDPRNPGAAQPPVSHPTPEPEKATEQPKANGNDLAAWWPIDAKVDWKTAAAEVDRNGGRYIDKDNHELDLMMHGIELGLNKPNLTEEKRGEYSIKASIITEIKRARETQANAAKANG